MEAAALSAVTPVLKTWIRNSAGCTKFNFCRVSSYSYVCIRRFINRDKYILTFILYMKISWVQGTHCLCHGKFWFLVVSNFDQRQNSEVNTCIRVWWVFQRRANQKFALGLYAMNSNRQEMTVVALSLFCLYRVSRVCVIFESRACISPALLPLVNFTDY